MNMNFDFKKNDSLTTLCHNDVIGSKIQIFRLGWLKRLVWGFLGC